jgi:MFS family permease
VEKDQKGASEFARHWLALAGATTAVGCGASLFSYTTNYFVLPLEAAEGWSRSEIAFGATLYMLGNAVLMPLVGMLTDRYGVGRVAPIGLAGYGLACLALTMLPVTLPVFYATMLLIAVFCSGTSGIVFGPFIAARFRRRRGIALSILLSGSAVLLVPFASLLTQGIADHGWRFGYGALGAMAIFVGLPAAILSTRGPKLESRPGSHAIGGVSFRQAVRTSAYWKIIIGVIASTLALGGFLNQMSPILVSRGLSVGQAAWLMSLFVLMIVIGRISVGALLDSLRPPLVAMAVMGAAAAGVVLLLIDAPSPLLCSLVVFLLGAAMGAEGDLQAFLIARHFGLGHFATLFGTSAMCTSACLGLGALLFGELYDHTGGYSAPMLIAIGLFIVSGLCFGSLGLEKRPAYEH